MNKLDSIDIDNKEVIFYDKDNTNIAKYVI